MLRPVPAFSWLSARALQEPVSCLFPVREKAWLFHLSPAGMAWVKAIKPVGHFTKNPTVELCGDQEAADRPVLGVWHRDQSTGLINSGAEGIQGQL